MIAFFRLKYSFLTLILFSYLFFPAQNSEKYDKLADSLIKSGQNEKLRTYLQSELKSKSNNESALRWLGYLAINEGKLEEGEDYYKKALLVNPNCARCYMNLARIYTSKKDKIKAFEYTDKAIDLDPKDASLYSTRAQIKEFFDESFRALSDYNKAIELDPNNYNHYLLRAEYNSKLGYTAIALNDLDKAIELAPKNYKAYFEKSSIFYNKRRFEESLQNVEIAIQLDSTQYSCYVARGAIYSALNQHEKSVADYSKAIQLNDEDPLPRYNRALSKYKLEDMDGSCEDVYRVRAIIANYETTYSIKDEIDANFNDVCDSARPSYYYQRGIAWFNLENYQKSVMAYTKGLKKFPDNPMILSFRGNSYFAMGDYPQALKDHYAALAQKSKIEAEVKSNPRFSNAPPDSVNQYVKGFVADMQLRIAESLFALGKYKEALTEIDKGITLGNELVWLEREYYYNVRGNINMALENYQQAKFDFDKCIALNPNFHIAYVNRALVKINLATSVKIISSSISGSANNQQFNGIWQIPVSTKVRRSENELVSALIDCNKAIELEKNSDFAFYVRYEVKKMLAYPDYCFDLIQAGVLGYPITPEKKKECSQ